MKLKNSSVSQFQVVCSVPRNYEPVLFVWFLWHDAVFLSVVFCFGLWAGGRQKKIKDYASIYVGLLSLLSLFFPTQIKTVLQHMHQLCCGSWKLLRNSTNQDTASSDLHSCWKPLEFGGTSFGGLRNVAENVNQVLPATTGSTDDVSWLGSDFQEPLLELLLDVKFKTSRC